MTKTEINPEELRAVADELIANISQVPNPEKALILTGSGSFSVADLIKDLHELTPRGVEYVRLWISAQTRLDLLVQARADRRKRVALTVLATAFVVLAVAALVYFRVDMAWIG